MQTAKVVATPYVVRPGAVVWAVYQVKWDTSCGEPDWSSELRSFRVLVCEPTAPGEYTMSFTMDGGVWGPETVTITG